jgi:hypothetical protein
MNEEKPPLSSAVLLADLVEKVEHVASASAMGAAQMTRAVRILDGNHALSARDRMALVDAYEKVQRAAVRLEAVAEKLAPRPKSITVVSDDPEREPTGIVYVGRDGIKRFKIPGIPTKYLLHVVIILLAVAVAIGVVLGRHGVQPSDVARATAPLVAP